MRFSSSSCWTKRITCVYSFSLLSLFVVTVFVLMTFDDSNNNISRTLITSPYMTTQLSAAENIFRYLHWTNSTSCLFAVDFGFGIWNGRGMAAPDGHKAVCLDQFIAPVYGQCLVYSFGINKQWSFDEAMDKFGCQVYSFDPSMPGVKNHNRTKNIHFYNIGLSGMDGINSSSGWKMKTASSIYKMLAKSHGSSTLIDVFKMDIEYSEWDAIPQMLRTGFLAEKVKQLAVEIHFNASDTLDNFQRRVGILQDLEDNGSNFIRFSSRPNPWLLRSISILGDRQEYIGLELAWYNSRYYNNGP